PREQLLSQAERRARAIARDAVAGARYLGCRHAKRTRSGPPRAGRNKAAPASLQRRPDAPGPRPVVRVTGSRHAESGVVAAVPDRTIPLRRHARSIRRI